ncbi:Putative phosphate regulon DNA-binding response regulator [Candidatus Arthromitus sp. SFB-mouse-SU]|uniref:response regulator transcription factor n=1 Tax=unclassified Candidatus Neoarthromitus TaxID=2638829 RepID=UPI00022AE75F|nr:MULTISPECIES: response regulator transcription factor [unclassified Candidatus Arthromitus]EIA25042.1 Putative phosphate regulon DNA-binding response regulator [Candidatus Arthromitus sp. SFB-2]EIA27426.1 Putative phosphate regulon DNA-binding response regulator [Candidatus Arthromitus sp. SFB-co]EIA27501.1 Putative phosphate regulon DNA-binding response regulator [Candidatus Arthromitus sp. SFB-5]EIA30860.1 Putative phosphate regulon DNA-binding response regulator [Candidatus Arthromitus sp
MGKKILIIEDELNIAELLRYNLTKNGFDVKCTLDGLDIINVVTEFRPELILLDLMLTEKDGFEICNELSTNENTNKIPIIIVSSKNREFDKILALDLGADDYICKPFSINEVIARIKAVFRRMEKLNISRINLSYDFKFGDILLDLKKREVYKKGRKLDMTFKEFELLVMLIKSNGRVLTREYILDNIWGYNYIGETRTVDVHVRNLRKKIENDDKNPIFIETVRGIGYKFNLKDNEEF